MTRPTLKMLAATLGALAFAAMSLVSGLDRYSEFQPGAIRLVPAFAQVDAARSRAATHLALGEYPAAAAAAGKAILRDPLDPRGPAFLGAAREMAGDPGGAEAAFRAGAALSWREPLTQTYWFTSAMEEDEVERAAIRLDALLRANPGFSPAQDYLAALERSPTGRAALAARIGREPTWAEAYLTAFGAPDALLRARAQFLAGPTGQSIALGCEGSMPMARELLRRNFRREAQALIAVHCPQFAAAGSIADADFERIARSEISPFGWRRHGSGDVRIGFSGGDNRALELESRAGVTRLVLSQPLALARGSYRVSAAGKGGVGRVIVSIDCGAANRPEEVEGDLAAGGQIVTVPDCADPLLGLWLKPGQDTVQIDEIRIEPL